MQISSRLQPVSQVPQSPQGVPTPAERRPEEAQTAARPAQQEPSSSTRERLGALAATFGERLDNLAASQNLSGEQLDALKEAHMGFLQNLQRLSTAHASEDAPRQSMSQGLAAVKEALKDSVHAALDMPAKDGGVPASERIAQVQQKVSERLGNLLGQHDLSPRAAAALEQMSAHFEGLFQRLGDALDGGKMSSTSKAGEAFASILEQLGQSVHSILDGGEPSSTGLYLPTGERSQAPLAGAEIEHLA